MTTRKVRAKQAFRPDSAADHNIKGLTADAFRKGPDPDPERPQIVNPCTAWIKNSSGADRRQFECLELDKTILLDTVTRENIWIDGIEPTQTEIPFAVMLRPVASAAWQLGQVAGICPALVDMQNITDRSAFLPDGKYVLESVASGGDVSIVQHPGATGEQLCVVLFQRAFGLRGGCLAENHPGRGVVFNLTLGTWNATQMKWLYNVSPNVKAIDWRYAVPYPDAGATGLFQPKPSVTHGTVWECVALDCDSPGACVSV